MENFDFACVMRKLISSAILMSEEKNVNNFNVEPSSSTRKWIIIITSGETVEGVA